MEINPAQFQAFNNLNVTDHQQQLNSLSDSLDKSGIDILSIIYALMDFNIAIPSWALGAGGTRFGRFTFGGEPRNLEEKIQDVAMIHSLTRSADSISLHIPWDIPEDPKAAKDYAESLCIKFDAVNSNTFQDQPGQKESYKFGSLSNESKTIRDQAIEHNIEVIEYGKHLGSQAITIWLADGSTFPGQTNFRRALELTTNSLKSVYGALPEDWKMLIEYKPYEPQFYHTVIQDWGTSFMLAQELGNKAFTLVDLGHHLPNTNIENIVATLMYRGKLGGFHFNDSKYGDDDLTAGSIKPYQLFLIFNELVFGMNNNDSGNPIPAWMIDASHNLKDPLEDLIQSIDAILIAYTKTLLIDQEKLKESQMSHDVVICEKIVQDAFMTDVRPLIREMRVRKGGAIDPLKAFREMGVREQLIKERGRRSKATGL